MQNCTFIKDHAAGRVEPTVSVVIPAKNEARNLPHVFAGLPRDLYEVILVDGNSTDDTVMVAKKLRPDITVIGQSQKAKVMLWLAVLKLRPATSSSCWTQTAPTDPTEITRFVNALKDGADFAKGSRFVQGGGSSDISRIRRMGNYWLNKVVNLLYGTRYTDLCYGYNAFRRECLSVIALDAGSHAGEESTEMRWGDGFEVETLINIRIAKAALHIAEVPSFEQSRIHGASNLNAVSDGIRVLRTIQAERHRGSRKAATIAMTRDRQPSPSWSGLSVLVEEAS